MSDTPTAALEAVDIQGLLELLPHRYPMLLVDKIVDIDGDDAGVGVKNVTFNEPQFQGHFPGRPVFPGVLLIEAMAQTAGAMCVLKTKKSDGAGKPSVVYFMTIDKVKFRKPVVPGDTVHFHMTKLKQRANMWWYRGEAKVDGKLVAEGEVSAMLVRD
jgi:3-hydroxyacyl-[acyl-carrier-protein] dehydratase